MHLHQKFTKKNNGHHMHDKIKCLKSGINGDGIPDLIVAQNSKQNNCKIYSLDSHFLILQKIVGIRNYGY